MRAQKWLNAFVRFIGLLERMGNGIGTLAFIWGTVVVLGGFSSYLDNDFWVATLIVFLEGFRTFSRQSRSDDQLLFKTTGGIKLKRADLGTRSGSLYCTNIAIMTTCVWMVPVLDIIEHHFPISFLGDSDSLVLLVVVVIVHKMGFYTLIGNISTMQSHILLHFIPAAALLLVLVAGNYIKGFCTGYCDFRLRNYILLALWFIIYILARFGSPGDGCPYHIKVKVAAQLSRAILLVGVIWGLSTWFRPGAFLFWLIPLVLGNLQAPVALARIFFSWQWLTLNGTEVHDTKNKNVKLAVRILYIMVMCQGILYLNACILESLSFLFRKSLALSCGIMNRSGMESIDLYYEHPYDTALQESLFDTTKKMDLVTFAVDSLNPKASREKKRATVRILDSLLQKHKTSNTNDTKLVSLITTSTKAVTTLISMLGWTVIEDADIRLFAAKVTAHLALYLQIVGIPGTMQKVSSLLDAQDQPIIEQIPAQIVHDSLGNTNDQQITNGLSSLTVDDNISYTVRQQMRTHIDLSFVPLDIEGRNVPPMRDHSRICKFFLSLMEVIHKFWVHFKKLRSIPHEDSKDRDSLRALGMQILEGLAHDLHNCAEISRAMELLPKIIEDINCINGTTSTQRKEITTSSLKLISKLASIKGEIGITLRQELSENPFLIGNLSEILDLDDSPSYVEQSKVAMDIIAKISTDKKTRQKIGAFQVIIDKLVQEYIGLDEDELSKPFRAEAGEALAMLAMECASNCCAILNNTNYDLIEDLWEKLQRGQHVYPAASLLQSLCKNSKIFVLRHQGSNDHLSSTLKLVLGRIKDTEGKQLATLIGLASQICNVMSECIAPVLDLFADDKAFVDKLVGELSARKKPSSDEFPETRRLLVELTISIVESCPRYTLIFREHGTMEALSKVEQYMGLVPEESGALPAMVARAKELISADTQ